MMFKILMLAMMQVTVTMFGVASTPLGGSGILVVAVEVGHQNRQHVKIGPIGPPTTEKFSKIPKGVASTPLGILKFNSAELF
jgi:hypothetical protein